MSLIEIHETNFSGLFVFERLPFQDNRGSFQRLFCIKTIESLIKKKLIRQINHTSTKKKGIVRGLHFQYPPFAETKIITCLKGRVFDVAVDLRKESPTFMQFYSIELSENNFLSILIPEGFAHGFQTLTPGCEMLYFHTADYNPEAESGFNALDPKLGIRWPESILERSVRDINLAMLPDDYKGIELL